MTLEDQGTLWQRTFEDVVNAAIAEHKPRMVFGLLSGGNDSTATVHRLQRMGVMDGAIHCNTSIGIEETREFVRGFCAKYGVALHELHPPMTYEEWVLGPAGGFPRPADHPIAWWRLKEVALNAFVQSHKRDRFDRIMLVTGVRRSESQKRKIGATRATADYVTREGAQVWVNPLIDYTKHDLAAYRETFDLEENPVSALLHRSGECLCGCFVPADELSFIGQFYPAVERQIRELEAKAEAAGLRKCRWGALPDDRIPDQAPGLMCTDCQLELLKEGSHA